MRWLRRLSRITAAVAMVAACSKKADRIDAAAEAGTSASAAARPSPAPPTAKRIAFVRDDLAGALQRAERERKLVFIDAWAIWCHTCLSMKHFVFNDPALLAYEERFVFVALDTDRPQNADFVERFEIDVWPTFFVLEAKEGGVLGYWPGAASLQEVRSLLDGAWTASALSNAGGLAPNSPEARLVEAKRAQAAREHRRAAELYRAALEGAPESWARASEARHGWIRALYFEDDSAGCVDFGMKNLDRVRGAALPADFASYLVRCALELDTGSQRSAALTAVVAHLERLTGSPPEHASVDDRSDALATLARARDENGDRAGARQAQQRRLEILEGAAREAPDPASASTFDYGRASAYVELGQPEAALAMLRERRRQLPDSSEPPGRLARLLDDLGRHAEALEAVTDAVEKAYGPRRLGFLKLEADLLGKLGRFEEQVRTREREVRELEALPAGLRDTSEIEEAQRRLQAARKRWQLANDK